MNAPPGDACRRLFAHHGLPIPASLHNNKTVTPSIAIPCWQLSYNLQGGGVRTSHLRLSIEHVEIIAKHRGIKYVSGVISTGQPGRKKRTLVGFPVRSASPEIAHGIVVLHLIVVIAVAWRQHLQRAHKLSLCPAHRFGVRNHRSLRTPSSQRYGHFASG